VLANNNASGAASITMTVGKSSLDVQHIINSSGCCVAPYANIGIFDACQASDQWGQTGSHLPLQLKDIAQLKGAWTFQVPMPLKTDYTVEQYRVYYEMFLSSNADGHSDSGNITVDFFWSNYGYPSAAKHANINGSQGMDVIDYGGTVGNGHGPFLAFLYPKGTYTPDSNGVVTVDSSDVKAVLDWAVANYPSYYTSNRYLTHLSLAVEAGAFHGTVKTTYASIAIQKTASDVVYTPPFTTDHWGNIGGSSGATGGSSNSAGGSSNSAGGSSSSAGGTSSTSPVASGGTSLDGASTSTATNPEDSDSKSDGCSCRIGAQRHRKLPSGAAWFLVGTAVMLAYGRSRRRASHACDVVPR
jgi:uncharacterized membrane protein YgcG